MLSNEASVQPCLIHFHQVLHYIGRVYFLIISSNANAAIKKNNRARGVGILTPFCTFFNELFCLNYNFDSTVVFISREIYHLRQIYIPFITISGSTFVRTASVRKFLNHIFVRLLHCLIKKENENLYYYSTLIQNC